MIYFVGFVTIIQLFYLLYITRLISIQQEYYKLYTKLNAYCWEKSKKMIWKLRK